MSLICTIMDTNINNSVCINIFITKCWTVDSISPVLQNIKDIKIPQLHSKLAINEKTVSHAN